MSDKQVCNGGICIPENFQTGRRKLPEWASDVLTVSSRKYKISTPALLVVAPQKKGQYGGRYFVEQNVIVVVDSGNLNKDRGVLVHETAHAVLTRGAIGLGRNHRGQHDTAFYEHLEVMYREFEVPLQLALTIEDSGGIPASWYKRSTWAR